MERDRSLLDGLLEGCQVIGPDYRYVYVNKAAARHGKRARDELVGRSMTEMYPGIENTHMFAVLRGCMDDWLPAQLENRFEFPDGTHGWFELRFERIPEGVFILSLDITARKHAELALARTTRALKALSECNQALVRATDEARFVADVCRLAVERAGYAVAWFGHARDGGVHAVAHAASAAATEWEGDELARATRGEGAAVNAVDRDEPVVERGDGGGFALGIAFPVRAGDDVIGALSLYTDDPDGFDDDELALLTEMAGDLGFGIANLRAREQVSQIAREADALRRRYGTLVDNIPGMAYRCGNQPGWPLEVVSPGCLALTGYTVEQLLGGEHNEYAELIVPEDRDRVWSVVQDAIASDRRFVLEYRIRDASGGEKWVWEQGSGVRDPSGEVEAVEGFITDITERKLAEHKLMAAQKLEAVGSLAGGVAHDFNNLLTVIVSYVSFAMSSLPEGDPIREDLAEVEAAAMRGASLTRQLLAFSRKQVLERVNLDINAVIDDMEGLLRRLLGEHIAIDVKAADGLGRIRADPSQIEQIVMNLAVNARDAMPAGGTLAITTDDVELDDTHADSELGLPEGRYVRLTMADTGIGMDVGTRARIFEPFFTTKAVGKGTGLGLSTVYGIVKQSNGAVWVYSEPGLGTTFKIYFPREVGDDARDVSRRPREVVRGSETVLLVEDDDIMRRLEERILSSAGYRVIVARDGRDALAKARRHAEAIELVVTDVVMPHMGGRELAGQLAEVCPRARILYISGYTDDAILHHGVLDGDTHFLAKPFSAVELTAKARAVLDG